MDAAITNNGTEAKFIPGPNINLDAGETKTLSDISLGELDSNEVIKAGVVAGTLSIEVTPGANDAALADQGAVVFGALPIYAVGDLPTGFNGRVAFASNGRKGAEGVGAGTGVAVYYNAVTSEWLKIYDNLLVEA